MKRRGFAGRLATALALTVILSLSLSGCNLGMDMETLLRPPRATGEQEKIQAALESYLSSAEEGGSGYVMKYPKSGEYRSSFILKDINHDGEEEAIAFYRSGPESNYVHINLLYNLPETGWQSVGDIRGASADVEEVLFGDLDGNGVSELIVGWNIYNVPDKQLVLYSLAGNEIVEWISTGYSSAEVADLDGDGRDNLMVLRANTSDSRAAAQLWSTTLDGESTVLYEQGSAPLDTGIQQFENLQVCALAKGEDGRDILGLFADGVRSTGGLVTELIYWDGSKLRTPFYNAESGTTDLTYRDTAIPSQDVDGDGMVEWPVNRPFADLTGPVEGTVLPRTDWMSWDYDTQAALRDFSSVVNLRDGYLLRLDDGWSAQVAATYQRDGRLLTLYDLAGGIDDPVLRLHTDAAIDAAGAVASPTTVATTAAEAGVEADRTADATSDGKAEVTYRLLERQDDARYEVWFSGKSPFQFDMERVRYLFARLRK